jgi:hypothetical protein
MIMCREKEIEGVEGMFGWRRALCVRLLWEIVLVGFCDFRKLMSPYCLSVIAPVMLMLTVSWVNILGVISSFK